MASMGDTWRLGRRGVFAAALVAVIAGSLATGPAGRPGATPVTAGESGRVVMATFSNEDMRAQIAAEQAGHAAEVVGTPYADRDPTVGVRDPSLVRAGGRYLLAYTRAPRRNVLGHTDTWGLAASSDLRSFRRVAVVKPDLAGGIFTLWAPDLLVDQGTLYCYWTAATKPGGAHQLYVQHTSLRRLADWSPPTLVRGLGSNVIDLTVRPDGGRYVGVVKDEDTARLHLGWATDPAGPFMMQRQPLPTGSERVEGPALVRAPSGGWVLAFDPFDTDHLSFIASPDLSRWSEPAEIAMPRAGLRHPSLLWLSRS